MKSKLIRIIFAMLPLVAACEKGEEPEKYGIEITVSEISTLNATVSVSTTGPAAYLVRMTKAVPKDEFLSKVETMDNETKIIAYINKYYDSAITVPYTSAIKGLNPETDYVIGALSYDADLNPLAWTITGFTTAKVGDTLVGDSSGAGSVTDNVLEDKPKTEEVLGK